MRPIEFRAWANNTMYYFVELTSFKDGSLGIGVAQNGFHDMHTASSDVVLMQYTGLKDAKGNKMYEGDIVRGAWSENLKPMVVEFQPPSFIMRISKKQWSEFIIHHEDNQLYIVIGNKYQHGELLNEQI